MFQCLFVFIYATYKKHYLHSVYPIVVVVVVVPVVVVLRPNSNMIRKRNPRMYTEIRKNTRFNFIFIFFKD